MILRVRQTSRSYSNLQDKDRGQFAVLYVPRFVQYFRLVFTIADDKRQNDKRKEKPRLHRARNETRPGNRPAESSIFPLFDGELCGGGGSRTKNVI